jgi:precorrin-2/cobalt-factor-2 C20-methyltransferase
MANQIGTLYGIGVGPGDPELVPVKAMKILKRVHVVFAASSTKNQHSLAVNIARAYIPDETSIKLLSFPMTQNMEVKHKAWNQNARMVIEILEQGQDAAFITVGDSMTYSTFGYLLQSVQGLAPHITVKSIPGITSYQAAAARLNTPLVEGEQSMLVTSGCNGGNQLRQHTGNAETVVLLKAYRNVSDIVSAFEENDLAYDCVGISRCGQPGEEVLPDIKEIARRKPDYWTLIIAKQRNGHGMQSES